MSADRSFSAPSRGKVGRALWSALAVTALGALCALALFGTTPRATAQVKPDTPATPDASDTPDTPIRRPIHLPPIIVEPPIIWPHPLPVLGRELQLQTVRARVDVRNGVARTQLTQTFRNTSSGTVEGTYLFPLPNDAAATGFTLTQNGKRLEAETLDAGKARDIYQEIVRKLRDPGLLEYSDRGVLKASIFPVPAGGEVEVSLGYSQTLRADSGTFRYTLPLKLPVGGTPDSVVIDAHIGDVDARNVYSPTHPVQVTQAKGEWHASGEFKDGTDRPFALLWRTGNTDRVATTLVTYRPTGSAAGEDGYFLLLAAPDPAATEHEVAAKDVVFVADTSGSMNGAKIEQMRDALKTLLGNLNPTDRFNIVAFASDVNPFRPALVDATPANLKAAREFAEGLRALGSTDISDALQESYKNLRNSKTRPSQVVFMTDGQPTVGETDPDRITDDSRAQKPAGARVFTFGLGYDVNARLLDALAEDGHGASDYVLPQENIEAKVGALYSKIAYPVLTDPHLDWGTGSVYDVYPKRLPDVFRGSQVAVYGRFKGATSPTVRLSGTLGGGVSETKFTSVGGASADADTGDAIARLWATRKIGTLLDDARREGTGLPDDVRTDLISLAKRFGIVTPLTSLLITEDEARNNGDIPMLSQIPTGQAHISGRGMSGAIGGGTFARNGAADALSAPASGQAAVEASRATKTLRRADSLPSTAPGDANGIETRYMGGKTFYKRGDVWTDADYDVAKYPKPRVIKFGSTEYWTLARDAQTAKWLAVGEKIVFVSNGEAIRVEP